MDTVHQCRGVPDAARRLYQSAFQGHRVCISTGVGLTAPVSVTRGCPQGAVSSPALSRAAQDPVLRLRECSPAAYTTSAGRRVACTGYADDVEHYGNGLSDLPLILSELGAGSAATGIGFAWRKFWAFASDWDDALPHLSPLHPGVLSPDGASVTSWDIWSGGVLRASLPRVAGNKEERLLGKRGSVLDRHSLAAADLLGTFDAARRRLSMKHCTWDECVALYQWIVRGVAGYAPLVGIPSPVSLHEEDAAFQRLILSGLGIRSTAERVSLLAASHSGGLGAPSVVETLVASCASDLVVLLSGVSTASLVARDSLRYAMSVPAEEIEALDGLVVRAFRFLSGYGFYATVSTDRFVGCILDVLALGSSSHSMVGPFSSSVFASAQRFCRIGALANTIRSALSSFWPLCLLIAGVTLRHGPRTLVHPAVCLPRHWRRLLLLLMPAARPTGKLSVLFFVLVLSPLPFLSIGFRVPGKIPGVMMLIRDPGFWMPLRNLFLITGILLYLGTAVPFPMVRVAFVRRHAALVVPVLIGSPGLLLPPVLRLVFRRGLGLALHLFMLLNYSPSWLVYAGVALILGICLYLTAAPCLVSFMQLFMRPFWTFLICLVPRWLRVSATVSVDLPRPGLGLPVNQPGASIRWLFPNIGTQRFLSTANCVACAQLASITAVLSESILKAINLVPLALARPWSAAMRPRIWVVGKSSHSLPPLTCCTLLVVFSASSPFVAA